MAGTLTLTLRQKKLLYDLQYATEPVTGTKLADKFHVSSRTIRTDVRIINKAISPYNAEIVPLKSKGYSFKAENPELISELNRIDQTFLSRDNRVRYLAFSLALSDEPLNLYDLEDEIFVSSTTLRHDLDALKGKFTEQSPFISLFIRKDCVFFEDNEAKRRQVLNMLYFEGWNYQGRRNAYYTMDYIGDDKGGLLDYISGLDTRILEKYLIRMEDPCLISLHIAVAIMLKRVKEGHSLPDTDLEADSIPDRSVPEDAAAMTACEELLGELEKEYETEFNAAEKTAVYDRIRSGHLMDAAKLTFSTVQNYFGSRILNAADHFMQKVHMYFHFDLSTDEDFYITLLQFIQFIDSPAPVMYSQPELDNIRNNSPAEFEIAYLFQDVAISDLGYFVSENCIQYLTALISGALVFLLRLHEDFRINTVICSQLNLPGYWALKRQLISSFGPSLNITDLLSVNARNLYDFEGTDLILSTIHRQYADPEKVDTIVISPFLSDADRDRISAYIHDKRIRSLCRTPFMLKSLFESAYWHEQAVFETPGQLIDCMTNDFISDGICDERLRSDIYERESLISFAYRQSILFMHSFVPAAETKLSISILKHRINFGDYRIRIAIMAVFASGENDLIVPMLYHFYSQKSDPDLLRVMSSRAELEELYLT